MKLTQFSTRIFVEELDRLSAKIPEVQKACNAWLEQQKKRDMGYGFDQYIAQGRRTYAETQLTELRHLLATVYDFMSERGMVDFEAFISEKLTIHGKEIEEYGKYKDLLKASENVTAITT